VVEGLGKLRTLASLQAGCLIPWDASLALLSALQALTSTPGPAVSLAGAHQHPWPCCQPCRRSPAPLALLSALQALTSTRLLPGSLDQEAAAVLAGLGQLQEVTCKFEDVSAAAVALAAGRSSFLGEITDAALKGAPVTAPPRLYHDVQELHLFDTAAVECLELDGWWARGMDNACQALARCTNLRSLALSLGSRVELCRLLQAASACSTCTLAWGQWT
jgi:hypothetical protein